jgi:hypothetical protein
MKFLVTGVSMFNSFIPTLTEHGTYLHLHYISLLTTFNKHCHIRESVVSRID